MTTSSAILRRNVRPFVLPRRVHPRKPRIVPQSSVDHRAPHEDSSRIIPIRDSESVLRVRPRRNDPESTLSPGDVFAFVTFLALTVVVAVTTVYGAHYLLSEIARQSTASTLRMFGGLP